MYAAFSAVYTHRILYYFVRLHSISQSSYILRKETKKNVEQITCSIFTHKGKIVLYSNSVFASIAFV